MNWQQGVDKKIIRHQTKRMSNEQLNQYEGQQEMILTANASVKLSSCLETLATAFAMFFFVTNMTSENDNPCNKGTTQAHLSSRMQITSKDIELKRSLKHGGRFINIKGR